MEPKLVKLLTLISSFEGMSNHECSQFVKELEELNKSSIGTEFEPICCNIFHYLNDSDIREKDIEYKLFQDSELSKLKAFLNKNDLKMAQMVTFLNES